MGRDAGGLHRADAGEVSIHAPAWGATFKGDGGGNFRLFQSTRPHGARRESK